jgi:hypothetical protein
MPPLLQDVQSRARQWQFARDRLVTHDVTVPVFALRVRAVMCESVFRRAAVIGDHGERLSDGVPVA